MSSPAKFPPSDMASPARKPGHPWQLIWYQIVFLLRLCLIFVVAFFLLAALNVVILNARQPIHCPNASQPPASTTADDATSPWISTFHDETSRDMFYHTANLTMFLEEDVRGVVLLSESLEILSENDTMLAVEQAITAIEQLSDDAEGDPDLPVDLIDGWYGLGTDARMLFLHLVALHDAGFYAMRSFALQLRHIDLALDKLWKSWTPWDYVELRMQMKTSCGVLKEQLALLNGKLDNIHAVVETSKIDAAGIEKVIQDMHRTLILEGQESGSLWKIWNTLDNLTFVNEDFMGVVDPLYSVLSSSRGQFRLRFVTRRNQRYWRVVTSDTHLSTTEAGKDFRDMRIRWRHTETLTLSRGMTRRSLKFWGDHTLNDLTHVVEETKDLWEENQELEAE